MFKGIRYSIFFEFFSKSDIRRGHQLSKFRNFKAVYLSFHWLNNSWTGNSWIWTCNSRIWTRTFELQLALLSCQLVTSDSLLATLNCYFTISLQNRILLIFRWFVFIFHSQKKCHSFHCNISVLHFRFRYIMKHSKSTMKHAAHSTDLGEWRTNMDNEAKKHWIRKCSSIC